MDSAISDLLKKLAASIRRRKKLRMKKLVEQLRLFQIKIREGTND